MGGMFGGNAPTPQPVPPPPAPDAEAILAASRDAERRRAMARGRASTYLTDPSSQLEPDDETPRKATAKA